MLNTNCHPKTNHRVRDVIPVEYFDLYDRDRRLTGIRVRRGDPVPPDCYRLAIHVCLFNQEGSLLIQKRQPFKRKWSGLWDLSVAGSAVCGENSQEAAERETLEELGLEIDLIDHRPALTVHWEKGFDAGFKYYERAEVARKEDRLEEAGISDPGRLMLPVRRVSGRLSV